MMLLHHGIGEVGPCGQMRHAGGVNDGNVVGFFVGPNGARRLHRLHLRAGNDGADHLGYVDVLAREEGRGFELDVCEKARDRAKAARWTICEVAGLHGAERCEREGDWEAASPRQDAQESPFVSKRALVPRAGCHECANLRDFGGWVVQKGLSSFVDHASQVQVIHAKEVHHCPVEVRGDREFSHVVVNAPNNRDRRRRQRHFHHVVEAERQAPHSAATKTRKGRRAECSARRKADLRAAVCHVVARRELVRRHVPAFQRGHSERDTQPGRRARG
mmetsp:Transcript_2937/g.11962  ORF Transcript_2937/g.11962 Transcript_2937/m.11962 type:complete len:275 (+) Transcript_2937:2016-2840(+)